MKGRVHYCDADGVLLSRGRTLLSSSDGGEHWVPVGRLPVRSLRQRSLLLPFGARLTRSGFHHVVKGPQGQIVAFAHQGIYALAPDGAFRHVSGIIGSRPLAICTLGEHIYYGEYCRNPERAPIRVFRSHFDDLGRWEVVWEFDAVRHVHSVQYDSVENALWVTTGDDDHESALWRSQDGFTSLERIIDGSQRTRVVQPVFDARYVYFGSDAPDQVNHLYRLARDTRKLECLAQVGGPVFYGTRVGGSVFFSTVVEPSEVNTSPYAQVWQIGPDGAASLQARFRKDRLPGKIFQYGQVLFAAGPGDGRHLWFTPLATQGEYRTWCIDTHAPDPLAGLRAAGCTPP